MGLSPSTAKVSQPGILGHSEKLVFAYPNLANISETFVYDQLRYFDPTWALTGGWCPFVVNPKAEYPGSIGGVFEWPLVRRSLRALSEPLYRYVYSLRLEAWLRSQQPTAVLAHYGVTSARMILAAHRAGVPLIAHFHGFDATHRETLAKEREAYALLFRHVSAVVAVSRQMVADLTALGCAADRIHHITCGVSLDRFQLTEVAKNAPLFVATTRLTPKKAPLLLLRAFAEVVKQVPDARLEVAGEGGLRGACEQLIAELGIESKVMLWGAVGNDKVVEMLGRARAYVQHSVKAPDGDSEGLPVSILEAAAAGLPVVSTRHAGIPEAVAEGETGALVNEHDWQAMVEPMIELARNPELAARWGRSGRSKMLREFDQTNQLARLQQVVASVARR